MNKLESIDIARILPDENQPRKIFNQHDLEELANSISDYGLLQPIIVKPNDKRLNALDEKQTYTIVAGERRYRACILAGQNAISVLIRDEKNNLEVSLIENMQRKDLNKIEEAAAIKHIMLERRYTQNEVAKVLSKSRPYIANALRILNLSPKCQQALIDEKISDAHARVLVGIKEEREKIKLLEKIINEKLSVREAERYSKRLKEERDIILQDAIETLEEIMETKVVLKGNAKNGTLCISYNSESELSQIVEILQGHFSKSRAN